MDHNDKDDLQNSAPKKTWVEPEMTELPLGETRTGGASNPTGADGGANRYS